MKSVPQRGSVWLEWDFLFGGAGEDDRAPTEERSYVDDEILSSTDTSNR